MNLAIKISKLTDLEKSKKYMNNMREKQQFKKLCWVIAKKIRKMKKSLLKRLSTQYFQAKSWSTVITNLGLLSGGGFKGPTAAH